MYVCLCRAVSDRKLSQLIREGVRTEEEVGARCGAGTVCGSCRPEIRRMIYEQGYCGERGEQERERAA